MFNLKPFQCACSMLYRYLRARQIWVPNQNFLQNRNLNTLAQLAQVWAHFECAYRQMIEALQSGHIELM